MQYEDRFKHGKKLTRDTKEHSYIVVVTLESVRFLPSFLFLDARQAQQGGGRVSEV